MNEFKFEVGDKVNTNLFGSRSSMVEFEILQENTETQTVEKCIR